jgi:hypothetical protein
MTTTATSTSTRSSPFSRRRLLVVAVIAAVVNVVVFLIGSAAGASMIVTSPQEMEIPFVVVIIATLVPLLLAGIITWLIAKRAPAFRTFARWAGTIVAVVSVVEPFLVTEDTTTAVSLAAMHIVGAAAWFVALKK